MRRLQDRQKPIRPSRELREELAQGAREVRANPEAARREHDLIRSLVGKTPDEQRAILEQIKTAFPKDA